MPFFEAEPERFAWSRTIAFSVAGPTLGAGDVFVAGVRGSCLAKVVFCAVAALMFREDTVVGAEGG